MSVRYNDVRREDGAILVQTAVMILVLAGLSTYVIDYGIVWLSRGQAQNAADAGALAGAVARAFDDFGDPPAAGGPADVAAHQVAQGNFVWNTAPGTVVTWACPAGVLGRCVRVDAHRDGSNGSATLPTFFGPLLGVFSQGVKATATARAIAANATNCLRPWAVADRWQHVVDPPQGYDHWDSKGPTVIELDPHDIYIPPSQLNTTGYSVDPNGPHGSDVGTEVILKQGNPAQVKDTISAGWFLVVRLPDGQGGYTSGAQDMEYAIANCVGQPVGVGDYLPIEPGVMVGPTEDGTDALIAKDPLATWNAIPAPGNVDDSCAPSPACGVMSPRIVPLAVFDMDEFQRHQQDGDWSMCPGGGKCVRVVNILGFFVDRYVTGGGPGGDVIGYLMTQPGEFVPGAPNVTPGASFLTSIHLVR